MLLLFAEKIWDLVQLHTDSDQTLFTVYRRKKHALSEKTARVHESVQMAVDSLMLICELIPKSGDSGI